MQVTGHRGSSVLYRENTMNAFKGAKELGGESKHSDLLKTFTDFVKSMIN